MKTIIKSLWNRTRMAVMVSWRIYAGRKVFIMSSTAEENTFITNIDIAEVRDTLIDLTAVEGGVNMHPPGVA